jgi:hypothetical protein
MSTLPDLTPLLLVPETGPKSRTTWADFKAANADGLGPEVFVEIAEALQQPFCSFTLGGGAQPLFYVAVERVS